MSDYLLDTQTPQDSSDYLFLLKQSLHQLLSHQAFGNMGFFEYSEPQKFNDSRIKGSQLWQEFALLPSYYIHHSERQMLPKVAQVMKKKIVSEDAFVFLGVGDGIKESEFAQHLEEINTIFLYDMSLTQLETSAQKFRNRFPTKQIQTILGDYCHPTTPTPFTPNNIVCEFGGTVANQQLSTEIKFPLDEFVTHLQQLRRLTGQKGYCIISYDCNQDEKSLHECYQGGDTFALNLLYQISQIDPSFDPEAFIYRPRWIADCHLYAHILVSTKQQTIQIDDQCYRIEKGRELFTNHSFKPTQDLFHQMAQKAELTIEEEIRDPNGTVVMSIMSKC